MRAILPGRRRRQGLGLLGSLPLANLASVRLADFDPPGFAAAHRDLALAVIVNALVPSSSTLIRVSPPSWVVDEEGVEIFARLPPLSSPSRLRSAPDSSVASIAMIFLFRSA